MPWSPFRGTPPPLEGRRVAPPRPRLSPDPRSPARRVDVTPSKRDVTPPKRIPARRVDVTPPKRMDARPPALGAVSDAPEPECGGAQDLCRAVYQAGFRVY